MSGKGINNSASQVPGNDGHYVIVITRWNEDIVTGLLKGATQALVEAGIEGEQFEVVSVPGRLRDSAGLPGCRPTV
jgi:6,7-dimethyl-8-ribityllumazine synthase